MMKTAAIGRLSEVTKLLQTQRRESMWRMQDFCPRGSLPSLFRGTDKVGGPGVSVAGNF